MALSETDICNLALQKLGAARVTSLNDQSVNARACSAAYAVTRDAMLAENPWNFATQRFQLPASSIQNAFGPTNTVPLPPGWLRVLPPDTGLATNDRDWVIEGNSIQTYQSVPLNVRITMQITDTSLFPPMFSYALAARLSFELCEALTQSNEKKKDCWTDYTNKLNDAKKANMIQKVPQQAVDGNWITSRL